MRIKNETTVCLPGCDCAWPTYDQLPGAELRLARARDAEDEEEIAPATRALSRVREEIDA